MTISNTQNQEVILLIKGMKDILLSSLEGTAKVAKAIQEYLGCSYNEAVEVLQNNFEKIF